LSFGLNSVREIQNVKHLVGWNLYNAGPSGQLTALAAERKTGGSRAARCVFCVAAAGVEN
jgi:hypothetical protein